MGAACAHTRGQLLVVEEDPAALGGRTTVVVDALAAVVGDDVAVTGTDGVAVGTTVEDVGTVPGLLDLGVLAAVGRVLRDGGVVGVVTEKPAHAGPLSGRLARNKIAASRLRLYIYQLQLSILFAEK